MSNRTLALDDALYSYLVDVSLRESDVARRLRDETAALPNARMQISPELGQFMQLLVRTLGATRTLEVGVFTGYSTLCVATALPAGGQIVACDVSDEWTSIGRRYWREAGVETKVDLRLAPAVETLRSLLDGGQAGTFDFAFIDADKVNYPTYYGLARELVRPGGIVALDNVLWGGAVADLSVTDSDTAAIRRVNQEIHEDSTVDLSLVPIGDGLTLARKR